MGSIPTLGRSPGGGHGIHFSTLAWRIPRTEEPGRLQSIGSQRAGHNLTTEQKCDSSDLAPMLFSKLVGGLIIQIIEQNRKKKQELTRRTRRNLHSNPVYFIISRNYSHGVFYTVFSTQFFPPLAKNKFISYTLQINLKGETDGPK